jgi:hypothetical protein
MLSTARADDAWRRRRRRRRERRGSGGVMDRYFNL